MISAVMLYSLVQIALTSIRAPNMQRIWTLIVMENRDCKHKHVEFSFDALSVLFKKKKKFPRWVSDNNMLNWVKLFRILYRHGCFWLTFNKLCFISFLTMGKTKHDSNVKKERKKEKERDTE